MKGVATRVALVLLTAGAASCGRDEPAIPLGPSVFTAQVAGQWNGTSTLNSVTGLGGSPGECVGEDIAERLRANILPNDRITLSMTQESSTLSGHLTSANTGLACSYKGRAALTTLTLDTAACDAPLLVMRCTNGSVRDLKLAGSSITGTFSNGRLTGTITNTYNAFQTAKQDGVANVVLSYGYSATRQ